MHRTLNQILFLCLAALLPAIGSTFLHPKRLSWDPDALQKDELSLLMVEEWKEKKILWVDARSQEEYDREHIPGAVLLNEDAWDELVEGALRDWIPGQPIVVYCSKRDCQQSQKVAARLREVGVSPVYVLKGGWESWLTRNK